MAKRNLFLGGAIPMESGERDRAVTVQQATETEDSTGFPIQEWTTLVTPYWMRIDGVKGHERFTAGQESAPSTIRWEGGYRTDLDPELVDVPKTRRLLYQGRVFDITDAQQIGRREGIEFMTLDGKRAA